MNAKRIDVILLSVLLLVSAVASAGVAAQTETEAEPLSLDVRQDESGAVTVTVADNGTAVENATVNVTAAENDTYAGTGEYETDANGTVSLSVPDEPATITVEANYNGSTTTETVDIEPALDVDASGVADGSVVVTVTRGDAAVENATVNVTAAENDTYAGTGEYETDANGTVTLANPDETVELTITATDANDTATTTVTAESVQTLAVGVDQASDGTVTVSVGRLGEPVANATVTVEAEENGSYVAADTYETDETGTVALPAPSENVTVIVTATDANDTATTTAELTPPEPVGPFGQIVSSFVRTLKGAGFTGIGSQVSDFVTSNNPSNDAGNSKDVAPPAAGNDERTTPPGQEGNESRAVPAAPPVENPGNSGSAPGQSDDSDEDESDEDDAPGNSGSAPGQSDDGGEDDDAPGNSGSAPGQSAEDDEDETEADEDDEDDEDETEADAEDESESNGNGNGNAGGNGNGR